MKYIIYKYIKEKWAKNRALWDPLDDVTPVTAVWPQPNLLPPATDIATNQHTSFYG